jgi:hypothetical protein
VTLVNGGEDAAKLREGMYGYGREVDRLNGRGLWILIIFFSGDSYDANFFASSLWNRPP